ncbi:hypothetical protein [Paraburkholderia humisilvae]|uniref:hypothetical protein n=1 Tax=Paraburkholderia humisilvae TaxID=627669 RepID=UPI001582620D|nr:hypothetical protein [Paraburkholderia humisilvae]
MAVPFLPIFGFKGHRVGLFLSINLILYARAIESLFEGRNIHYEVHFCLLMGWEILVDIIDFNENLTALFVGV